LRHILAPLKDFISKFNLEWAPKSKRLSLCTLHNMLDEALRMPPQREPITEQASTIATIIQANQRSMGRNFSSIVIRKRRLMNEG
jgi:hypothetical protein